MEEYTELTTRLVALAKDLILFPSTISRPDDRERCFQFIKNHVDAVEHVRTTEYRSSGFPSLLALPNDVDEPVILLCGHLDVVQHAGTEKYIGTVIDGRLEGVGAGDMKGALAVLLELFRDLHHRYTDLSLGLAVTSDEEVGGENGLGYLVDELGCRSGIALIPDGGSLNEITVEEKGVLHLEVNCQGCQGRSSHAARPWLSDNPLETLLARLARLRSHFDALVTGGDHWYPTCAITGVETPNESINRVPESARAILDVRFPAPRTAKSLLEEIRTVLGDGVDVRHLISAAPTYLSPDSLFVRIAEEVTGRPVTLVKEPAGSDARFLCRHGIPVILSRPLTGNLHGEDEWIDIGSMVLYYRICERYVTEKLLKGESPPGGS